MTRVKICGMTRVEDARHAIEAGADAIGFIFAESPRRVLPQQARDILREVDLARCVAVGVFMNSPLEEVLEVVGFVGLHSVQLHGDESAEMVTKLQKLGVDVVKSFRVCAEEDLVERMRDYHPTAFLLDTWLPGRPGGTGESFDWQLALKVKKFGRVILAGGLNVESVRQAIDVVHPYGVDASSRLEVRPGIKDHDKIREFIRRAKFLDVPGTSDLELPPWPR